MKSRTWLFYLSILLWVASSVIAILWYREAVTVGRGFVSAYLAPISFTGPMIAFWLMWLDERARK